MNFSKKTLSAILCISFAALLGNSALAHEKMESKGECKHFWSKKDGYAAHFDKRMSALQTSLQLTSNQEASWTEFSNKLKPVKIDRPEHQDWKDMSTPDRLDRRLDQMKSREKEMADHAAAVRTFYDTLTQDQKKIFDKHFQPHHSNSYDKK
ncbi:MAG: Spy/CpxP family protein refolding chaperone [Candidatus Nitrotoga sp.]|nr:Spy/CpxP family protein refolding chaperone [Candidatus Nitrotoga sp.]MDP1855241.1 Spy/CpxP family protein refolding chaperone [Candidatus Nitrotoga sp.]RFC39701.1 MAG: LTXXQ motif family protein [Candidatus Nitrotoga sp. CP45]